MGRERRQKGKILWDQSHEGWPATSILPTPNNHSFVHCGLISNVDTPRGSGDKRGSRSTLGARQVCREPYRESRPNT